MTYKEFNKYIYNHYFNEEKYGETIIIAVDESIIANFCSEYSVTPMELQCELANKFSGYGREWSLAFEKDNEIPSFFGLIAIQVYNAFLMRNEGYYTANAYRGRLADYLMIYDERLDYLFRCYQDDLWRELKTWAISNNFKIEIPDIGWGKGRYVQYPLSQAILNQEDLKKTPLLFKSIGLKPNELLTFIDFKRLVVNSENYENCSNHYIRIRNKLEEQNKGELLYYQLFDFYNNTWNGSYPEETIKTRNQSETKKRIDNSHLILNSELNLITIFQDDTPIKEFSIEQKDIFKSINQFYKLPHDDILFFQKDETYEDFMEARFLETNSIFIIICKIFSNPYSFIGKLDSNYRNYSNSIYGIFEINTKENCSDHYFWKSFYSSGKRTYTFENGLKLSRKTWMFGAGPSIKFEKKTRAWINGKRLDFSCDESEFSLRDYPVGTYKLKVENLSPDNFEIKDPVSKICLDKMGWQVNNKESCWKITVENYQISGLTAKFSKKGESSGVRAWVAALTKKSDNERNSSIVINAIKQSKNGI